MIDTRVRIAVTVVIAILAGSCSLEYDQEELATELSAETPDTVLYQVTHTIVSDGVPRFVVRAARAETFSELNRQYLSQIEFQELAADRTVVTRGRADTADYEMDTENIEISGNVSFYSAEQDATLTADILFWDSESRVLTSEPREPVFLQRGDGTAIRGRGFVAEMGRSIIRFEDGVSGTIIEESDD